MNKRRFNQSKDHKNAFLSRTGLFAKPVNAMKKMLFAAICLSGAASPGTMLYAQANVLHTQFVDRSISEVLSDIEKNTNYNFLYNNAQLDTTRKVSVNAQNKNVFEVLDEMFKGTNIAYRVLDNNIVLYDKKNGYDDTKASVSEANGTTVSGRVVDSEGEGIVGVTVMVNGTSNGTMTDLDGNFQLSKVDPSSTLRISCIGYKPETRKINGQKFLKILLADDSQQLDEVVVIGYGTVKKKDLTGAVSVVDKKSMSEVPTTSVLEAMSGTVPGIDISMNGRPGDVGFATIRGISNFTNNTPLYVIDGLPTGDIRDLSPNDIESIQVLKDASSAAIYGSRAANGVIIITTKKGAPGSVKINFSASYAIQHYNRPFELAGAEEWSRINDVARTNAGLPTLQHDLSTDVNWLDAVIRTGNIQQYNVSLSGGNDVGNYYVSGEFYKNDGVLYGSGYERFSVRVNTNAKKGIFTMGQSLTLSNNVVDPTVANTIGDALAMAPVVPIYNPENPGGYGYGDPAMNNCIGENPIAHENLVSSKNKNFRVRGTIFGELAIFKNLRYRLNLGYELNFDSSKTLRREGNWRMNMAYEPSYVRESSGRFDRPLVENTLTFDDKFGKHAVTLMVGNSFQKETYTQISGKIQDILMTSDGDYYDVLNAGTSLPETGGYINRGTLISYLGRFNYIFDDRYFLTVTFRRDGSSKVKKENRWGNFPSVSVAWRLSNEKFMKPLTGWLNDLKIRASHGTLGSMNIGYYDYLPVINTNLTATFGKDQLQQTAATQTLLVNENLKWESQTQTNFGLDFAAYNNRLTFSADYYISKTKDVLTAMPILLTAGNGLGNPVVNAASLENRGFEFLAGWQDKIGKVSYFANLSVSTVKNKVTSLGYGREDVISGQGRTAIGHSVGEFYLIKTDGLFQSEDEIKNYTNADGKIIQPDAKPGDVKYIDYDGDGKITDADRQLCGTPHSLFQGGLNMGMSWNNFDLKMNWYFDIGCKVFNATKQYMWGADGGGNGDSNYLKGFDYWTPEHHTDIPRPIAGRITNRRDSDYWLENGSYVKLKSISLGYSIPQSLLHKIGVNSLRLSVSCQNVFCLTNFSMQDPEYRKDNIWNKGYRGISAYPNPLTVNFGAQLSF